MSLLIDCETILKVPNLGCYSGIAGSSWMKDFQLADKRYLQSMVNDCRTTRKVLISLSTHLVSVLRRHLHSLYVQLPLPLVGVCPSFVKTGYV